VVTRTSWCASAALLQKAVVTATDVSIPAAICVTRSVADDSVMAISSGDMMPLIFGKFMTESSAGKDLIRHSCGIEAAMRAFLSEAVFSHAILRCRSSPNVKVKLLELES
jgi:hypothetical protein